MFIKINKNNVGNISQSKKSGWVPPSENCLLLNNGSPILLNNESCLSLLNQNKS